MAQAAGEKWRSMTANEKRRFEDLSQNSKVGVYFVPLERNPFLDGLQKRDGGVCIQS